MKNYLLISIILFSFTACAQQTTNSGLTIVAQQSADGKQYKTVAGKHVPYANTVDFLASVVLTRRHIGEIAYIYNGLAIEVWQFVGGIADSNLVKVAVGSSTIDTLPISNRLNQITSALNTKQPTLVSGTNIKTINGFPLLGGGNINITGTTGGVADTNAVAKKIAYYLVMGQSNMVGGATDGNASNTQSDPRLKIWYPAENRFAPLVIGSPQVESAFGTSPTIYLYLGKLLLETNKYTEIRFVYSAEGAQPINTWYYNGVRGRLLDSAINRSNAANVPLYDGFVWNQGEAGIANVPLGGDADAAYVKAWFGMREILKLYPWFNDRVPSVVVGMPKSLTDPNLVPMIPMDKLLQTFEYKHNWVGYANTDSSAMTSPTSPHYSAAGLLNNAKNVKSALEALPSQYAMIDLPSRFLQLNGQTFKAGTYFESRTNVPWHFRLDNGPAIFLSKAKTVFGYNSANNSPGGNQVFGDENMPNNTLSGNSVFGGSALRSATAVGVTVAIGSNVFYYLNSGSLNTGVGLNAGFNFATGTQNTVYGYNAGNGIVGGDYNTVIGSYSFEANTTVNSAVVLSDGRNRARIYGNDNLDLGIGTILPTEKLDVAGNIKVRSLATSLTAPTTTGTTKMVTVDANGVFSNAAIPAGGGGGSSPWTTSVNDIYNSNTGKVGIGTSTPNEKLDVAGNALVSGLINGYDAKFASFKFPRGSYIEGLANDFNFYNSVNGYANLAGKNVVANGNLTVTNLATGLTPPPTIGITKPVIADQNGKTSLLDEQVLVFDTTSNTSNVIAKTFALSPFSATRFEVQAIAETGSGDGSYNSRKSRTFSLNGTSVVSAGALRDLEPNETLGAMPAGLSFTITNTGSNVLITLVNNNNSVAWRLIITIDTKAVLP